MVARIEATDRMLVTLAVEGAGPPQTRQQAAERPPPVLPGFDALALARIFYLGGTVAAFASVRLVAGLLLALAPFFLAFLLFDGTRGLFEGWLRTLLGAALGTVGVSIVLGIELALLETWLAGILAARTANVSVPNAPVELLVTTGIFALVLAAMLWALARLAMGFHFASAWQWMVNTPSPRPAYEAGEPRERVTAPGEPAAARSRAIAIADAVMASQRREDGGAGVVAPMAARIPASAVSRGHPEVAASPLGHTFRRRTVNRVSASAGRRDQQ